jgi:3-deoxy-D-manno-octulosonic-acid transferase
MSARSARRWSGALAAPLAALLLRRLRLICPMNDLEADRLRALCPSARFGPSADLKAAAACTPCAPGAPGAASALQAAIAEARRAGRFVWLAASTHAGEEEAVADAHTALAAAAPPRSTLTLLAPRHPARAPAIAAALAAAHPALRVVLLSRCDAQQALPTADVLLVDALGLLPALYASSHVSFVGNSLPRGGRGHNLVEAAAGGCALLCGLHCGPFQSVAARLQAAEGALQRVADARQLGAALVALRAAPQEAARRGDAAARTAAALAQGVLPPLLRAVEAALAETPHLLWQQP